MILPESHQQPLSGSETPIKTMDILKILEFRMELLVIMTSKYGYAPLVSKNSLVTVN